MKNIKDWGLTALGIIGAVGNAIINIDWVNFDIKKEWPKLVASVVVAAVGYFAQIKTKGNEQDNNN